MKQEQLKHLMEQINLVIVGASGFGREVLQWIEDCNKSGANYFVKGFIDDNLAALDGIPCDVIIIDSIKDYKLDENDRLVLAIALPKVKKLIVTLLEEKGAKFENIIHPTAIIGSFSDVGKGVVITPFAKVSPNVKIGNFVTLLGSGVGHDAVVEDYCTITGNCSINGHVLLGEGSFIGSNTCIAPGKKIGAWANVAMGSMVISNVKPETKVMGNPAQKMKF